jgi:hypothetical protein
MDDCKVWPPSFRLISVPLSGSLSAMVYTRYEEEGRALAYIGSIIFSIGLTTFSAITYVGRQFRNSIDTRRSENWPVAAGRILTGDVKAIHGRLTDYALGTIGYSYQIEGDYYSGYSVRQFWDEQRAWTFVDSQRDKSVLVHYKLTNPQVSILTRSNQEGTLNVAPQSLRPPVLLSPGVAILWKLSNVSDWAKRRLDVIAKDWPAVSATIDYAEPKIVDDDDERWGGEMRYKYSVNGDSYSNCFYFRAYGLEDAREQVEPWRNRKVIVHYYPGNPARSVFIPEEQLSAVSTE